MLNTCWKYNNGHSAQSTMINTNVIAADIFVPYKIGNVLAPSFLSPSISSISFVISLAVVITNAKNPKKIEVEIISGVPIEYPPNAKHNPVMNPTVKLPISGVDFNLYA